MNPEHLSCSDVVELLTDYLEGGLDADTGARVEVHLAVCPPCVTYLEQLRATITGVGALPPNTLPDSTIAALEVAFRGFGDAVTERPGGAPGSHDDI